MNYLLLHKLLFIITIDYLFITKFIRIHHSDRKIHQQPPCKEGQLLHKKGSP